MSYFLLDNYDKMSYNKTNKRKEVIIMKKYASLLMSVVMLFGVVAGTGTTAFAGGWLDYAQDIELDTVYTDSCSASDCKSEDGDGYSCYNDVFCFSVPAKGVVNFKIESEKEEYAVRQFNNTNYYVYRTNDVNNYVWTAEGSGNYYYSSATDKHYNSFNISLNAGTYYLVAEYYTNYKYHIYDELYGGTYDFELSYKPSVPKPSQIKASKIARKSVKLSWSKASGANGYQLQRKTGSGWKTIANTSSSAFNVKKLKSKTKYRFRVRAYKVVNGKKYYSAWSSTKTVVTKK